MGCTSSREARYDRRRSFGSYHRSSSLPPHNTISRCTGCGGGGYHTVSLSSSTLGTLKLDSAVESDEPMYKILNDKVVDGGDYDGEFSSDDIANAMTWSEMIEQKIPKTPTRTPPNEPETINVWELMEGLDDISPACRQDNIGRSFSFHATLDDNSGDDGSNDEFDDSNGEKDDSNGRRLRRKGNHSVGEVLVQWEEDNLSSATWEGICDMKVRFPDFDLEDKVEFLRGESCHRPLIYPPPAND